VGARGGSSGQGSSRHCSRSAGHGTPSHPEGGYDKKTQARDIAAVMDKLRIEKVTHDIGKSEIIVLIYVISYIIMLITFPAYATGSKNKNGLF